MNNLPLNEALNEMAIRVFATREYMAKQYAALVADKGEAEALTLFNIEAFEYGIQAI
jgi:hypothetical protein